MKQIYIFLIIIFLISLFLNYKYQKRENFVLFNGTRLNLLYLKKNISNDSNKGILTKCQQKKCKNIQYSWPQRQTNNINSSILSNNKAMTSRIFELNKIPCPKFINLNKIISKDDLSTMIENYNLQFPLVVKPVDGTQGYGVHLNITDIENLFNITQKLQNSRRKNLIIEEQVFGDNYRIMVFNGKIIDILRRELASVTGDGKSSIQKLIDNRNILQKKKNLHITHNISYNYIKSQCNLDINDILPKNKTLYITNIANFHNGCNSYHVRFKDVHPENLKLFKKINKILGLSLSGIDYMANDISLPYYKDNHHVIEVNSGPDMKIHTMAMPLQDIQQKFVNNIF